jgi:hypothetical protein
MVTFTLLVNTKLQYILIDGTQNSKCGTAFMNVIISSAILFSNKLRFTIVDRDGTKPYETFTFTIVFADKWPLFRSGR